MILVLIKSFTVLTLAENPIATFQISIFLKVGFSCFATHGVKPQKLWKLRFSLNCLPKIDVCVSPNCIFQSFNFVLWTNLKERIEGKREGGHFPFLSFSLFLSLCFSFSNQYSFSLPIFPATSTAKPYVCCPGLQDFISHFPITHFTPFLFHFPPLHYLLSHALEIYWIFKSCKMMCF